MTTMEEIAKRLGVTKGTVSKAINGANDISETMRKTILETAVEMGYRVSRGEKRVCILIANMAYQKPDDFGAEMILGFRKMAEPAGFQAEVVPLTKELQAQYTYDEFMLANHFEGAFVLVLSFKEPGMEGFKSCRTPAVLYDCPSLMNPVVTSIGIDNYEGMALAVAWLKELGHRKIGYLGGALGSHIYQVRYDAYFQAMRESGLEVSNDMAGVAFLAADCLKEHFQRIVDLGCTAIICSHDLLAYAVMIHCGECGIRIPEDLSVIGIDDLPLCRHTRPPLASIRQNRLNLGRSAFYAVSSQIAQVQVSSVTLHAELIRRESVSSPRMKETVSAMESKAKLRT